MLLSHIFGLLILCFSFTVIAFDGEYTTSNNNWQKPWEELRAERPGSRRRGRGCKAPSNIWTINIFCEIRTFCYVAPEDVRLMLEQTPNMVELSLNIKNTTTHDKVELNWPVKKDTLAWPVDRMPIESGVRYALKIKMTRTSYYFNITLLQIPADYKTPTQQANWMEKTGCVEQAEFLRK